MYKKILVALDRSEMGNKVFAEGFALAKLTKANLMLLHVLSGDEDGSPYLPTVSTFDYYSGMSEQTLDLYQQQWESWKNQGLEMLQSFSTQANTAGINTEFSQIPGSAGKVICDLAGSWGADIIVIGRRGHSGLAELFLGSVSNYVLHHAPCSVHVVYSPLSVKETELAKETKSISTAN